MSYDYRSGVIPAPFTPFETNGAIDWPTFERYKADLAAGGASAIAINMAASEAGSLEPDEQMEVVRRTKKAVDGACPVVSGVIATSTGGAIKHAQRLIEAGADALVIFPPLPTFLSKPLPASLVIEFHAMIAEAAGVPIIAFQTANAAYPVGTIKGLASIPNIKAIKDAAFDIERTWEIIEEAAETEGKIAVMTGNDTFVVEALLLGCQGALIGFAGTATRQNVRMQTHAAHGEVAEAYALWQELGPLARFCWKHPLRDFRARMKYVLAKQGIFPTHVCRHPQQPVSDADRAVIDRLFDRYGYGDRRFLPRGE